MATTPGSTQALARAPRAAAAPPAAPRSQGGRPTRAAAAELERRILDEAAALFAAQGYAATSMEQVAEVCKAGKDTIYRRYASKGALFTAVMARFRAAVVDELGACLSAGGAPAERLRRYARALLDVNLRPQLLALNRVALAEAIPSKGVQPTPSADDPFMRQLAALVGEAQDAGALRPGDALFIAEQLLYATSIRPLVTTMLGEAAFSTAARQDAYFEQAWTLFLHGAAAA